VGMVGSVLARLSLGVALDQHGPKIIWLGSLAIFAATCFAHLAVARCNGVDVYLLRILYCTAIAGVFGASTTFISARVNPARMAELVGMLGTSGFLGMMLGAQLGDLLLGSVPLERRLVDRMFVAAGLLGLAAIPFAWLATRRSTAPASRERPHVLSVLRKHQPGFVLAVGVATGAALALPQTFLRTFAAELDIPRIWVFFAVVASTAVTTRVANRRLPDRVGLATMIFIGTGLMAAAQLLYLVVRSEWQLVFPAMPYGIAQAILFPMIAAVGTSTFPMHHRGLGITLVLASFDVGQLIGAPAAGGILHVCELLGMPGYPTLFTVMAAMLVLVGIVYWWTLRRQASLESSLGVPVILRFPRTTAHRRPAPSRARSDRESASARPATARPHAGSSRSTAAAPR